MAFRIARQCLPSNCAPSGPNHLQLASVGGGVGGLWSLCGPCDVHKKDNAELTALRYVSLGCVVVFDCPSSWFDVCLGVSCFRDLTRSRFFCPDHQGARGLVLRSRVGAGPQAPYIGQGTPL